MTVTSADPNAPAQTAPRRRSILRGVLTLARRSPISAFWGVVAALIVLMAVSADFVAPYPPLKSDFR
ncbi:MAG: ABC transporter permease, partial [Alphaproteobacteria bacterium]|nr:ABC transporter permease [Alphaproteobacteria bacterium]